MLALSMRMSPGVTWRPGPVGGAARPALAVVVRQSGQVADDAATGMHDDLHRFVVAQDEDGSYHRALGELRRGRKSGHWMWFVFPQIAGLGHSQLSRHFALAGLAQAQAYLAHPVLGPRLDQCVTAVLGHPEQRAEEMLGGIDAVKLRSSMTLFERAEPSRTAFGAILDTFFDGVRDPETLCRL